jgi:hypothetical protein
MQTSNLLLAAFLATHNVSVTKIGAELFNADIGEDDPIVQQFEAPDGYNANIHRVHTAMEVLQAMEEE